MMQRATTGLIEEYAEIDETIAPQVLQAIGEFLARIAPTSRSDKARSPVPPRPSCDGQAHLSASHLVYYQ